jgi:hypothetical protein
LWECCEHQDIVGQYSGQYVCGSTHLLRVCTRIFCMSVSCFAVRTFLLHFGLGVCETGEGKNWCLVVIVYARAVQRQAIKTREHEWSNMVYFFYLLFFNIVYTYIQFFIDK